MRRSLLQEYLITCSNQGPMIVVANTVSNEDVTGSTMDGRIGAGISSQDTMQLSNNPQGLKFHGGTISSNIEEGSLHNIGGHFTTKDSH
jgi:hypothetical protein